MRDGTLDPTFVLGIGKTQVISLTIRVNYPDIETFIERYAANVARGGMFIQSKTPQPVGTKLELQFLLADGAPLIIAQAKVLWAREFNAATPTDLHGMGVKFTKLDTASQDIIKELLFQKSASQSKVTKRRAYSKTQEIHQLLADAQLTTETEEPTNSADDGSNATAAQNSQVALDNPGFSEDELDRLIRESRLTHEELQQALAWARNAGASVDLDDLHGDVRPLAKTYIGAIAVNVEIPPARPTVPQPVPEAIAEAVSEELPSAIEMGPEPGIAVQHRPLDQSLYPHRKALREVQSVEEAILQAVADEEIADVQEAAPQVWPTDTNESTTTFDGPTVVQPFEPEFEESFLEPLEEVTDARAFAQGSSPYVERETNVLREEPSQQLVLSASALEAPQTDALRRRRNQGSNVNLETIPEAESLDHPLVREEPAAAPVAELDLLDHMLAEAQHATRQSTLDQQATEFDSDNDGGGVRGKRRRSGFFRRILGKEDEE